VGEAIGHRRDCTRRLLVDRRSGTEHVDKQDRQLPLLAPVYAGWWVRCAAWVAIGLALGTAATYPFAIAAILGSLLVSCQGVENCLS